MKKFFRYLIVLLILLAGGLSLYIYSLKKVRIKIQPNTNQTFYDPDTTEFVIPVSLAVKDIENLANKKLKTILFNGKLPVRNDKDTLHLKLVRAGDLRFTLLNNLLKADIPLYAEAYYSLHTIGKKSATFFKETPVNFSLNVQVETPVEPNNTYGFNPSTSISQISWKKPPIIKIGPVKKDISEATENLIRKKEDLLTARLDSILRERISLKEPVEKVWTKLQRSAKLRLDKGRTMLYLRKKPLSAAMWLNPQNSDSLHFKVRLKGFLYILDASDTTRFAKVPLPKKMPLLKQEPTDDSSHFYVQVALPLKVLEEISSKKLSGKTVKYIGYEVGLKDIDIYNGEKDVLLSLKYDGDFEGEVRVKGFPRLDLDKKMFDINRLEFESREDGVLLGSAEKLFHDDIRNKIKEAVQVDMTGIIDTLPQVIRQGIDRSKLSRKADVTLDCLALKRVKTNLTADYIHLMVEGSAQLKMNLKREAIIKEKKQ